MSFFLDTNTCVYALKGVYASIERELARLTPDRVRIASIVRAELLSGARKSRVSRRTFEIVEAFLLPFEVTPFCAKAADAYAVIRSELEKKGSPIGPNDLVLAATVAANGGTLVTHNTKEFRRVKRLKCVDWVRE